MKKKIIAVLLAFALAAGPAAGPAGIVTVQAEEGQEQETEDGFVYKDEDYNGICITKYNRKGFYQNKLSQGH